MKILIAIILAFIIADIIIVTYVLYRRYKKGISKEAIRKIKSTWKDIIRQTDHRHAIMDADKLLDHTLGIMGYRGGLGNKLKKNPHLFKNLNQLWASHKVRNNIAHQINYKVTPKAYKEAMLGFKQAFKDLRIF